MCFSKLTTSLHSSLNALRFSNEHHIVASAFYCFRNLLFFKNIFCLLCLSDVCVTLYPGLIYTLFSLLSFRLFLSFDPHLPYFSPVSFYRPCSLRCLAIQTASSLNLQQHTRYAIQMKMVNQVT